MSERERRTNRTNSSKSSNNTRNRKGKKRRRKRSRLGRILVVLLVAILVIVGVLGISYFIGKKFAENYLLGESISSETEIDISAESAVLVEIPQEASTKDIAEILKDNGLISSELYFRLRSKMSGADGTYCYGTFYLADGMSAEQIIAVLQTMPQADTTNRITIPEGYTVSQIAALVDEMGIATSEEFITEMNTGTFEYDFLEGIPVRDNYLEGYLFPDTYFLSGDETAHDIIVMMLNRFEEIYNESIKDYVASTGYTLDELVTVASMVESEAKLDEERATIAGVIYNRLNIDMLLQIDSTVQYALSTRNEVVTTTDLQVDSPYNTYMYKGLPEGPICNPGQASLIAAVQPESHNYLYYVLKEQGGSEHVFTDNYEDFLTAKAEYQATFTE